MFDTFQAIKCIIDNLFIRLKMYDLTKLILLFYSSDTINAVQISHQLAQLIMLPQQVPAYGDVLEQMSQLQSTVKEKDKVTWRLYSNLVMM